MALALVRWGGRLLVACAAIGALVWQTPSSLPTPENRLWRVQDSLGALTSVALRQDWQDDLTSRANRVLAEGGRSLVVLDAPSGSVSSTWAHCPITEIDLGDLAVEGFLSPDSCMSTEQLAVQVFEFRIPDRAWVEIELRAGSPVHPSIDVIDMDGRSRISVQGVGGLSTISEWLDPGVYRIPVTGTYYGGGPYTLHLLSVGESDLGELEIETPSAGGRAARARPWTRVTPHPRPLLLEGPSTTQLYRDREWNPLPVILRPGQSGVVAGRLRDTVNLRPLPASSGTIRPGEPAEGRRAQARDGLALWDLSVATSSYVTLVFEGGPGIRGAVLDANGTHVAQGAEEMTALLEAGRYSLLLSLAPGVEDYRVRLIPCGRFTRITRGRPVAPQAVAGPGCDKPQDVYQLSIAEGERLGFEWTGGDPVPFSIFSPAGRHYGWDDLLPLGAGTYNLVTAGTATATLTIGGALSRELLWERQLQALGDSLIPGAAPAVIGVAESSVRDRLSYLPSRFSRLGREAYFVSDRPEVPFCVNVGPTWAIEDRSGGPSLDACWIYGRFGAPSESVSTWLRAGALSFAASRIPSQPGVVRTAEERGPYGAVSGSRISAIGWTCRAGDHEACRTAFDVGRTSAEETRRTAPSHQWNAALQFDLLDRSLFVDLMEEFGEEAFLRFWTYDGDVLDGFEAAFGVEAGEWTYRWAVDRLGPTEPTVRLRWLDVLMSIIALAGLAVLTGTFHSRVESEKPLVIVQGV